MVNSSGARHGNPGGLGDTPISKETGFFNYINLEDTVYE